MIVKLKGEGNRNVQHKSPLSKEDLNKLYDSFDLRKPKDLQNKVFVDFMLFFCNRGRENLREVTKGHFTVHEEDGYIELRDMATKNHRGNEKDTESQGGRIYRIRDDGDLSCSFASFVKYLCVLNSDCELFFQRPKKTANSDIWFDNIALGKNSLGDKMKVLSTEAKLSKVYTKHCLRATSITLLNGYEARHLMSVSGHKSETSIRSYARTDDLQKQKMALTIAEAVAGTTRSAAPAPTSVYRPGTSTAPSVTLAPTPVYRPGTSTAPSVTPAPTPVYRPGTSTAPSVTPAPTPVYRPGTSTAPSVTLAPTPVYRPGTSTAPSVFPAPTHVYRPGTSTAPSVTPAPTPVYRPGTSTSTAPSVTPAPTPVYSPGTSTAPSAAHAPPTIYYPDVARNIVTSKGRMTSTQPGPSSHGPNFAMNIEDMDFLDLTSSQETTLLSDIQTVINSENQVVSATPEVQQMSVVRTQCSKTDLYQLFWEAASILFP